MADFPGINRDIDESSYGFGDTYIRPLWLGWNLGQADIGALSDLHIPEGKYDAGDADNVDSACGPTSLWPVRHTVLMSRRELL